MPAVITSDLGIVESALVAGGCVAIPTDTVYGIAARLHDPDAIGSLFEAKGRDQHRAVAVLVDSVEMAAELGVLDSRARRIVGKFWPGPLTIVVDRKTDVIADLGGDPATIGLRAPDHDLVVELIGRVGPLATTSANRSGEPALRSAIEIEAVLGTVVAAILDGGVLGDGASTVADLRGPGPVILREGSVSEADLRLLA